MRKQIKVFIFLLLLSPIVALSQLNSPYSRYGVGNLMPQSNLSNRAMGGIAAAIADPASINTLNPASYGNLVYTTLDVALEYNGMQLRDNSTVSSFKSNDAIFSYLNFGFPLLASNKKASDKKIGWGLSFGLKPETRISYKITQSGFAYSDSMTHIFGGDGGVNKAYIGSALKLKNFSLGFNTGYLFGRKDYNTELIFGNDSLQFSNANYINSSRFGGAFLDAGIQFGFKVKKSYLRFGAYTSLKTDYSARQNVTRETFTFGPSGEINPIDSVFKGAEEKGKVTLPATYGFGVSFENDHLTVGADFETTQWSDYRFFGQPDLTQNSWLAKAGFQYYPATTTSTSFLSFMKYRAGISFGSDYLKIGTNDLPVMTISAGVALPMRLRRSFFDRQFSMMNVTFEYGRRGNTDNNITERSYRIGVGFSLSDIWFIRQKYQ